jgi:hypothetical protein
MRDSNEAKPGETVTPETGDVTNDAPAEDAA